VVLEINYTGNYQNITVTTVVGNTYSYLIGNGFLSNQENVTWWWIVNDSAGNSKTSSDSSFVVANRNIYNVTITNPSNNSYSSLDSILINFTSTDPDSDTINYTLYNSTDGTSFSILTSTTTESYLNYSGYEYTEGEVLYYYINASDGLMTNSSETRVFTLDITNPQDITIIKPDDSPTIQCSLVDVVFNFTYDETNLDYCTVNMTSGGSISYPHTILPDCNVTTIYSSYDNTVQTLTLGVYDLAGNSNSSSIPIYFKTTDSSCGVPTPPPGGGGGITIITPINVTFCGDGECNPERGETFYNCPEDCAPSFEDFFDWDSLFTNCFSDDPEIRKQCVWRAQPGLLFIFVFFAIVLIFSMIFEFKNSKPAGRKWFKNFTKGFRR